MTKDEALKLALEALDCIYSPLHVREINKVGAAMTAIKEALAQPEEQRSCDKQEPAEVTLHLEGGVYRTGNPHIIATTPPQREWVALTEQERNDLEDYCERHLTSPPQEQRSCDKRTWVGLTDEEIGYYIVHSLGTATKKNLIGLIRLCESKLKEKNT